MRRNFILSRAVQMLCIELSRAFYFLMQRCWASFCWLTDLHGVTLPPARNSSYRKNPGTSWWGRRGGYFSDTLEYFKAQFVLNFWNTFGGRTSTQYIKVSSEGARKHSEKYKQEHLAIFFHAQQESSVSKWKCSMSTNDANLSSLHLSFSIAHARALHFIQS